MKNAFYFYRGTFWRAIVFPLKLNIYLHQFGTFSKIVLVSSRQIFGEDVKAAFSTSLGIFWAEIVSRKKKTSFRFRKRKKTFSALCWKHSRRGCQSHNLQVHKEVFRGGEILYWKRFYLSFFSDHDRNILGVCWKKFNRVVNMHSMCQIKSLEENKKGRWKKNCRIWKNKLRRVCQNLSSQVHENSLSGRIFRNNFHF